MWMGSGVLAAAAAIAVARTRMAQEPPWLEKMNEFQHFVFHLALVMGGLILGSVGLAALLSSTLWKREPPNRHDVIARALNKERTSRLQQSHLVAVAVADLAVVTVVVAKRHFIEPLWLYKCHSVPTFLIPRRPHHRRINSWSGGFGSARLFPVQRPPRFSRTRRVPEPLATQSLLISHLAFRSMPISSATG